MLPKLKDYRGVCVNELTSESPYCVSCLIPPSSCTCLFVVGWDLCVFSVCARCVVLLLCVLQILCLFVPVCFCRCHSITPCGIAFFRKCQGLFFFFLGCVKICVPVLPLIFFSLLASLPQFQAASVASIPQPASIATQQHPVYTVQINIVLRSPQTMWVK